MKTGNGEIAANVTEQEAAVNENRDTSTSKEVDQTKFFCAHRNLIMHP